MSGLGFVRIVEVVGTVDQGPKVGVPHRQGMKGPCFSVVWERWVLGRWRDDGTRQGTGEKGRERGEAEN